MIPTFGEANEDGPIRELLRRLFSRTANTPETAPTLPAMSAMPPDPELLSRHGWDPTIAPGIQKHLDSPFADTLQAIFGGQPFVGTAREMPENLGAALAFVDPELAPRIFMNPRVSGGAGIPNTLTHEMVHTRQTGAYPEFNQLMEELEPEFKKHQERIRMEDMPRGDLDTWAAQNPQEHMAYAIELAMQWIRNQGTEDELELLDNFIPGVKRAQAFLQERLEGM